MNQQPQERENGRERVGQLFDTLEFLYQWGYTHPIEAQSFTVELREMVKRYLHVPTPDTIRLQVEIPLRIFNQYLECYTAPRSEDILIAGIEEVIAKHKEADGVMQRHKGENVQH